MSDEITKPTVETTETPVIEEPTISETMIEPVTTEVPVPILVTSPSSLEPNLTTEPVIVTEPAVIEASKESAVEVPEPVVVSSPAPVVEDVPVIEKPVVEDPTVIPESKPTQEVVSESSLETNHLPLEPNPRPYSLDPKLNKAIEAFVRGMNNSKQNLILAKKAVQAKMMKKVYRIMDIFKKKKKIKNDDVEKFIHTSDKTATKYLNILTKEGKVKREGNPHNPYYTKVE